VVLINIKNLLFLLSYSAKRLVKDLVDIVSLIKDSKTWSFILFATVVIAVYYQNILLVQIALPLMVLVYIVRIDKDPHYSFEVKKRAFINGDEERIQEYYYRYVKQCFFSKAYPLGYEAYKKEEIRKLMEKSGTGLAL